MFGLTVIGVADVLAHTETAATAIVDIIPPRKGAKARLRKYVYTPGATTHTLTVMCPQGRTTLSAAALAAQAVVNLTADPGTGTTSGAIAAADYLVIEKPFSAGSPRTFHIAKVSSVATLAITLTANVPTGGFSSGAAVWFFGAAADAQHPTFALTTGAQRTPIDDSWYGLCGPTGQDMPILMYSDNATNAGTLNYAQGIYILEGCPSGA